MKNTVIITALLLALIWGCSDESEEVVKEQPLYSVTCYSSNRTVVIESQSHAHPKTGSQSSYAWKDINGTNDETSLRCMATLLPPTGNEKL